MISYLIVNQWKGDRLIQPNMVELFRRVKGQGAQARAQAVKYATELNGGKDFGTDKQAQTDAVLNGRVWYTVCAIPTGAAQEYRNYLEFEECEYFK